MQRGFHSESAAPTALLAAPQVQLKSAGFAPQKHRSRIRVGAWLVVNPEQDIARQHTGSMSETLWIEISHEHTELLLQRFQSARGIRSSMRVRTHASQACDKWPRASLYTDHIGLLLLDDFYR